MEWELRFKGKVPPGTVENAKGLIRESFPRRVFGDALGLEIGDILFFLDNYKVTDVPLESQMLLNFSRTPDLDNPNSFAFQRQQSLLCSDVRISSLSLVWLHRHAVMYFVNGLIALSCCDLFYSISVLYFV